MPKMFTVDVEEIINYLVEVEAESAEEAAAIAEDKFFAADPNQRFQNWQYMVETNFDDAQPIDTQD